MAGLIKRAELVRQLGATVGDAKAAEAIDGAARALNLTPDDLEPEQALRILDALAVEPNIVGIAAKLIRVRMVLDKR